MTKKQKNDYPSQEEIDEAIEQFRSQAPQIPSGWEGFVDPPPMQEQPPLNAPQGRFLTAHEAETEGEISDFLANVLKQNQPPAFSILTLPIKWYRGGGHGAYLVDHSNANKKTLIGKFTKALHAKIFAYSIAQAFVELGPDILAGDE